MGYGVKQSAAMVMDFFSDTQATVTITNAAQDLSLPDVVVSLPTEGSIIRVIPLLKVRAMEDTSAVANSLSGAQNLRAKLSTGTWGQDDVAAINLVNGQFAVAASTKEAGDLVLGDIDIRAVVSAEGTYNFRLENAIAVGSNLVLHDVLVGLRVYIQFAPDLGLDPTTVSDMDVLLARFTLARALLLDEITALRMAELDAANMPADLDTLLARLTAARAALLDEITALRMAELDPANIPADIDTLLARLTAARAGYLDELDFDLQGLLNTIAAYLDTEIAAILGLVDSAESAGPYSYLDAGGEQDVVEDTATTRRRIRLEFSNRNMTQTGKFIIYRKVDGTNYDIWTTVLVTVAAGDDRVTDTEFVTNQHWKLTYTEDADEGAARAIPYNVITQEIE